MALESINIFHCGLKKPTKAKSKDKWQSGEIFLQLEIEKKKGNSVMNKVLRKIGKKRKTNVPEDRWERL